MSAAFLFLASRTLGAYHSGSETMARHVDNAGSTARDHLANERTFLAWVRTALGLVGLGVLFEKLVTTEGKVAEVVGLTLIAFGAASLLYSVWRYRLVASKLEEGQFPVALRGPLFIGVGSLLVAIAAIAFVFL